MSFTDPDHIADILDVVLDVVSTALTAAGRPVDRVFRSPGVPAWDCGTLAAYARLRVVNPGVITDSQPLGRQIRHAADVNILLTRCLTSAAVTGIPTATQIDVDGEGYATDQWVMQRALYLGARDSSFLPGGCTVARLNPVVPSAPQGGYSGMTTTLEVALG